MSGSILKGTEGPLPIESILKSIAFDVVATRKAKKRGVHVFEEVEEVGSGSIWTVICGWWEKRNEAQPRRPRC